MSDVLQTWILRGESSRQLGAVVVLANGNVVIERSYGDAMKRPTGTIYVAQVALQSNEADDEGQDVFW